MTAVERHLAQPESRIYYCLKNYRFWQYSDDQWLAEKALNTYYHLIGEVVDNEAHY